MSKRDRVATENALISAVGEILARHGLGALNAEALARQAGVNKALIYRYFGSLEGLVERFAKNNTFWPSATEIIGGDWEDFLALPRSQQLAQAHRNLIMALRERPMTRQIMAWELIQDSPFVDALEREREQVAQQIFAKMGTDKADPTMLAAAALFTG
ncbi:MAG: TetR/AcrR family transcriptional regulator, partial [Hyphomonadaceae bacterium]|nr:TetR/AcrR family transcriptional regulator [Hyphomonadaceae bacterium]